MQSCLGDAGTQIIFSVVGIVVGAWREDGRKVVVSPRFGPVGVVGAFFKSTS